MAIDPEDKAFRDQISTTGRTPISEDLMPQEMVNSVFSAKYLTIFKKNVANAFKMTNHVSITQDSYIGQ
jgi:hypothetical protein